VLLGGRGSRRPSARMSPMTRPHFSLETLTVVEPCHVPWDEMEGDDRIRFCKGCGEAVYNLATMTFDEIHCLLEGGGEGDDRIKYMLRPCVRFWRRADGTLVTRECQAVVEDFKIKEDARLAEDARLSAARHEQQRRLLEARAKLSPEELTRAVLKEWDEMARDLPPVIMGRFISAEEKERYEVTRRDELLAEDRCDDDKRRLEQAKYGARAEASKAWAKRRRREKGED
jgi:hypothetical protein